MGMQIVSACVCPQASLQCRCVASLWERARTTPERRDMGLTLESETGPRQGPYCIGVGRASGLRLLCYVMLYGTHFRPCIFPSLYIYVKLR